MDMIWSRYVQGCMTQYSSRHLRFHDRFREKYAGLFDLEDRPLRMTVLSVPYDNEAAAEDARRDPDLPHRDAWIREVLTGLYSR